MQLSIIQFLLDVERSLHKQAKVMQYIHLVCEFKCCVIFLFFFFIIGCLLFL